MEALLSAGPDGMALQSHGPIGCGQAQIVANEGLHSGRAGVQTANNHSATVRGFGEEWAAFDRTELSPEMPEFIAQELCFHLFVGKTTAKR